MAVVKHVAILFKRETYNCGQYYHLIPEQIIEGEDFGDNFITKYEEAYANVLNPDPSYMPLKAYCFPIEIKGLKSKENDADEIIAEYFQDIAEEYLYFQKVIWEKDKHYIETYAISEKDKKPHFILLKDSADIMMKLSGVVENVIGVKSKSKNDSEDRLILFDETEKNSNDEEEKEELKETFKSKKNINVMNLYKDIKEKVIGQDDAVKKIISIIKKNELVEDSRQKTNMLLIGPTGVGKTEIFRSISESINVPFVIGDITQVSSSGYVGRDLESFLLELYEKSNCNLEVAQNGILVLDEIDKMVTGDKGDVSGDKVLNSLLKMIEGTTFEVKTDNSYYESRGINFDTSKLTIASLGAFADLKKYKRKEMGFNASIKRDGKLDYGSVNSDDLAKYGMPIEFLGRSSIIPLRYFEKSDFVEIINKSKYSALMGWKQILQNYNATLSYSEDIVEPLAIEAMRYGIGARGIKQAVDRILEGVLFDLSDYKYNNVEIIDKNGELTYSLTKKYKKNN